MRVWVLGLIIAAIGSACTKASSAKSYKCQRFVHLYCDIAQDAEGCREAKTYLLTEMDPDPEHSVESGTAGDTCYLSLKKLDVQAQYAKHKDAEEMFAKLKAQNTGAK
jgi:hypothetical protein